MTLDQFIDEISVYEESINYYEIPENIICDIVCSIVGSEGDFKSFGSEFDQYDLENYFDRIIATLIYREKANKYYYQIKIKGGAE